MNVAALQMQSILRTNAGRINASGEPRKDVRSPSSTASTDEVAISMEAKKNHLIDQIVEQVVREITDRAVPDASVTGEPAVQEPVVV